MQLHAGAAACVVALSGFVDMQQLMNIPPDVYVFVYMLDVEQLCKPCCSMAAGHALAIKQRAQKRSKLRRYLTCVVVSIWFGLVMVHCLGS